MWLTVLIPAVLILANNEPFLKFLLRQQPGFDGGAVLRTLALLPALALVLLACAGLGWALRRLLGGAEREPASFDFALGVGTFSTLLFALALCGLLAAPASALLLLLGIACAGWALKTSAWRPLLSRSNVPFDPLRAAAHGFILWLAWHVLVTALAPPTSWDAIAYHLPLAKEAALRHSLPLLPWMLHAHFPSGFELVYAGLLTLGDDRLAALLHAACGLAAANLAYELFREEGEGAALCAAALFLAIPSFGENAGHADNDLAVALMVQGSLFALRRWQTGGKDWALLAAGLAAGFAAAFKLHGLVWCALAAASVWTWSASPRWKALGRFSLAAAVGGGAWYARAWAAFGNPVWPFAWNVFGGKDWSDAGVTRLWSGNLWTSAQLAADTPYYAFYLALLIAAALVWTRTRWRPWAPIVLPAVAYGLLSLPHHESRRYILAVLPELCWLAALAAQSLSGLGPWGFAAASAALLPVFLPALSLDEVQELYAVCGVRSDQFPSLGAREAYLSNALDVYPAQTWMNANLPATARVLFFREIRGYYLDRDYVWGDPSNQGLLDFYTIAGPEELDQKLRAMGVDYLLENGNLGIFAPRPGYYEPRFVKWIEVILRARGRSVFRDNGVRVFELLPKPIAAERSAGAAP